MKDKGARKRPLILHPSSFILSYDWRQLHGEETAVRGVVDPRRRLRIALAGLLVLLAVILGRAVQLEVGQGAAFRGGRAAHPAPDATPRPTRPHPRPRRRRAGLRYPIAGSGGPLSLLAGAAGCRLAAADGPRGPDQDAAERPAASGRPRAADSSPADRVGPPGGRALRPAGRAMGRPLAPHPGPRRTHDRRGRAPPARGQGSLGRGTRLSRHGRRRVGRRSRGNRKPFWAISRSEDRSPPAADLSGRHAGRPRAGLPGERGRPHLPERPEGRFAQMGIVPFSPLWASPASSGNTSRCSAATQARRSN